MKYRSTWKKAPAVREFPCGWMRRGRRNNENLLALSSSLFLFVQLAFVAARCSY
jgi:hypothetical protein